MRWDEVVREFVGVFRQKWFVSFVSIWLLAAVPATYAMMSLETVSLDQSPGDHVGKSVTLEPMNWVGKPFSLDVADPLLFFKTGR